MDLGAGSHDELHATRAGEFRRGGDAGPEGTGVLLRSLYELIRPEEDHDRTGGNLVRRRGEPPPAGGPDPGVGADEE